MATTVKLTAVGNSTGIILPRELLDRLRLKKGDTLHVLETPNGMELTPFDPEMGRQLDVAETVMRRRRNLLKKLAE